MPELPAVLDDRYYSYAELSEHLHTVAQAAPEWARLVSLHTTAQGRELWLLTLGAGATNQRPAYLVQANLHAPEVSGTTAALRLVHRLLTEPQGQQLLGEVIFHIIPRVNPDGAEYALTTGGAIRSLFGHVPRRNGLVPGDINDDGLVLTMRWLDPQGQWRLDEADPRLLIPREHGDEGPFYSMAPEGFVEDYNGGPIEPATRSLDFNRNWAANWQPEHIQPGAGDFAFSALEMRAIAQFVAEQPAIFGMLGFHNGCNCVLRPSATVPDEQINPADLRMMKQLGQIGAELTGFGLRAVRDYHLDDEPPLSLKGHFTDWGYFTQGLFVFEIELGNLFNAAGISTEEYFAADERTIRRRLQRRLMEYVDTHPEFDGWVDWAPVEHPQLGPVEVGGFKITAWACPPPQQLQWIGDASAAFVIEHARRAPKLTITDARAEHVGGEVYRVRATVANVGGLPTCITELARGTSLAKPIRVSLVLAGRVEVLSRLSLIEIDSLDGLGGHEKVEWFARRTGEPARIWVEASHPRAGTSRVELGLA